MEVLLKRHKCSSVLILLALMCCVLSGCKSSDYRLANESLNNEDFDNAIVLFTGLGDFKDSQQLLADSKLGKAVKCLNDGSYIEAKKLFQEYSADYYGTNFYVDTSGYNYACSYYILSGYLQSQGNINFNCEENYCILVENSGSNIYIGYEGEDMYSTGIVNGLYNWVAHFNNFFFYLPAPNMETPTVPDCIKWHYAKSDVLKGYETLLKANGTLEPSEWFELSNGANGKIEVEYLLNLNEKESTGSQDSIKFNSTAYVSRLIPYFGQVLDYLNIGLSLEDFGIMDLEEAIGKEKSTINEYGNKIAPLETTDYRDEVIRKNQEKTQELLEEANQAAEEAIAIIQNRKNQ